MILRRPSIDRELMIRTLIVGYCFGIRSERRLAEKNLRKSASERRRPSSVNTTDFVLLTGLEISPLA